MPWWGILIIVAAAAAVVIFILYRMGKKAEKRQADAQEQINAMKQTVSMLVIDKKKLPLKDSGLPANVIANTPKRARRMKLPIVKAKVGPKIMVLIAEKDIFDAIPLKKEIKATVSGIYITDFKGVRKNASAAATPKKKDGFMTRLLKKGRGEI